MAKMKLKSHKGLLKRIRVTGKGKVKFHKANKGHLMSHKTASKCRSLRKTSCAKKGDMNRLQHLLHRPLLASDAGPKVQPPAATEPSPANG